VSVARDENRSFGQPRKAPGSLCGAQARPPLTVRGASTTANRARPRIFLALLLAGALLGTPAFAVTRDQVEQAEDRLADAGAQLQAIAVDLNRAEVAYAQAQNRVEETRREIAEIRKRLVEIALQLEGRAVEAFMSGGTSTEIGALLSSSSFSEFSDRLEFVSELAEADAGLASEAGVHREELSRKAAELRRLEELERAQLAHLQARREAADARMDELNAHLKELQDDFKRQQRLLAQQAAAQVPAPQASARGEGASPLNDGAIQVCPVDGVNSFTDTFGAPRSGGRTHQGQDLLAAPGTPVVAVHNGVASQNYNSLGGNSVGLTHDGGDWTYYAHLSSYGQSGHVSAGTVIGYVGSTGNAGSVNHLHFEYHPGGAGAAAVNPYSMLRAVC
jgi:peptidoglycan LD-endopeptidase LytH